MTLPQLTALAEERRARQLAYAGELTPQEVFSYIRQHPAVVVDVRSLPEWQFTGVADTAQTQGRMLTLSWKNYPDFAPNARFAAQLAAEVPDHATPLFFLCRSGGRSLDAAVAMTAAGYTHCFNVIGGFEGDADRLGHRGLVSGWKAAQLPWKQS
jgi:rhodanese-related sulfurtransferase